MELNLRIKYVDGELILNYPFTLIKEYDLESIEYEGEKFGKSFTVKLSNGLYYVITMGIDDFDRHEVNLDMATTLVKPPFEAEFECEAYIRDQWNLNNWKLIEVTY